VPNRDGWGSCGDTSARLLNFAAQLTHLLGLVIVIGGLLVIHRGARHALVAARRTLERVEQQVEFVHCELHPFPSRSDKRPARSRVMRMPWPKALSASAGTSDLRILAASAAISTAPAVCFQRSAGRIPPGLSRVSEEWSATMGGATASSSTGGFFASTNCRNWRPRTIISS